MSRPETDRPVLLVHTDMSDLPAAKALAARHGVSITVSPYVPPGTAYMTSDPICPECFTVRAVNGECGCVG